MELTMLLDHQLVFIKNKTNDMKALHQLGIDLEHV